MTLFLRYSDPGGLEQPPTLVALGSNVRFGQLGVSMSAEVGQPDVSTITIDDPGGIWTFAGLRAFDMYESSAASNNQIVGRFAIQDRRISRSKERSLLTGADRLWEMDLVDYNFHLGKRVIIDSDGKRPVETAGDRLRWLLTSASTINLHDYGNVTYPTNQMDATDYRGQHAGDVIADCAVEGGYDFWCDVNQAHGKPELFFIDPNGTDYESSLTISNVRADQVAGNCYAPYEDATLTRSASRIAYGVYLAYTNGFVYKRKDSTGTTYNYVDQTAPMSNVKTAARANRIAQKFLDDNDSEADRIACDIKVPVANVNDVRQGHRISVRFSHFPGYESFTPMRVVKKAVIQDEEGGGDYYRIHLEMVSLDPPGGTPAPPSDYSGSGVGGLQASFGDTQTVRFHGSYAAPLGGWDQSTDVGPFSADAPIGGAYFGLTVTQATTARILLTADYNQAPGHATQSITLLVNGISQGTASSNSTGDHLVISVPSYHFAAGDHVTFTSTVTFWTSHTNGCALLVGRGTHREIRVDPGDSGGLGYFVGP